MQQNTNIFSAGSYQGLNTYSDPLGLGPGVFTEAKNIRVDQLKIAMREGITELKDFSFAADEYMGGEFFEYDGNVYFFFAREEATDDVRIYWSIWNGSTWSNAMEISAASGLYGATRMSSITGDYFTFTGAPGFYGTKYVVVQNGIDTPRLITIAVSPTLAIMNDITAPQELSQHQPLYTCNDIVSLTESGSGDYTVSTTNDSNFDSEFSAASGTWTLTIGSTGTAVGDLAGLQWNSQLLDCSDSTQVWFVADLETDSFLTGFKWELRDDQGDFWVIHDVENGIDSAIKIPSSVPGQWLISFPLNHLPRETDLDSIDGVRITVQNAGIAANEVMIIRAILSSGRVPGHSSYAVTWFNSSSQCESPSVVLRNPKYANLREPGLRDGPSLVGLSNQIIQGNGSTVNNSLSQLAASVGTLFGDIEVSLPPDWRLPLDETLDYVVKLPSLAPNSSQVALGVDYYRIYRKDRNEADFYYVDTVQVAEASGSAYVYSSPYTNAEPRQIYNDNIPTWAKNDTQYAPGAYNESPPVGLPGVFTGDRMYFGTLGTATNKATVKISDVEYPFRFRSIPISSQPDLAGYQAVLDGSKSIKAIIPGSSSVVGGGFVYVFTEKGCFTVNDYLVSKISDLGCVGTDAASIKDNRIWFIDQEKLVRVMGGGSISDISRYNVHDNFSDITNLDKASVLKISGRLYVKFANQEILVWNDLLDNWESLDTPGVPIAQLKRWDFQGESKLYAIGTNGNIFEYESGTSDDGTAITLALTTPEYHGPVFERINVGPSAILSSVPSASGQTMDVVYTCQSPVRTASGTITLDERNSGDTIIWKNDKNDDGNDPRISGATGKIRFSTSLVGPFYIYSIQTSLDGKTGKGRSSGV